MGEYIFLNTLIVSIVVAKWLSREPFNIKIWDLFRPLLPFLKWAFV